MMSYIIERGFFLEDPFGLITEDSIDSDIYVYIFIYILYSGRGIFKDGFQCL